jgi:hypothetical protein
MQNLALVVLAVSFLGIGPGIAARMVKVEPPMGALKEGQVVLVDDGSCPAGQIKRVAGGNHVRAGGNKDIVRERSCVPR